MQQDHGKTIQGLSIAAIVISALGILMLLIGFVVLGVLMNIYDSYAYDITNNYGYYDEYLYDDYYYYDYDYPGYYDAGADYAIAMARYFYGALAIWGIACSIFTLVAGIIGVRNAKRPKKLGLVFGWSIAGAIIGFLGTGIVVAIFFVIIAVFANKDKQLYAAGYYPAPQAVPGAPVYASPMTAPAAAPVAVADPTPTAVAPAPVPTTVAVAPAAPAVQSAPIVDPAADNQIPTASEGIVAEPSAAVQVEAMEAADAARADTATPGTPQA